MATRRPKRIGESVKESKQVVKPIDEFILPKGRLSPSQINSYYRCPKAYYYRYVEGLKEPPPLALTEGSSHHKALETNNAHKIKKKKDLSVKRVQEAFCDDFATRKKVIVDWQGEREGDVLARGKLMIKKYMTELAPRVYPIASEKKIETDIFGIPFLMYIDLTEKLRGGKKGIADYKTGGKMKSQREADNDLQLALYGISQKVRNVSFICLTKSTIPKVGRIESVVDARREHITKFMVLEMAAAVTRGSFPPADSNIVYTCSPKFCGFWNRCKGKRIKRTR